MEKIRNWKQDFYTIWAGQAVSLITSGVLQMAIIWHLTNTTGSAMVLSMATLVGFLPQAVLGSAIGVLVDRWNRKMVMIGADVIIACAGLVLTVISLSAELPVWIVMLILFIRSVGTAFHSPALSAVTPLLVPEEQLVKCAGYTQSIQSASFILSPAIAAFLYAKWGLNSAVALDVFGAIIACITVAMVHIHMGDVLRGDTSLEVSITHFIPSCHIREADGEIGFVGILKPQFLTLPFGEFNVYPPFLQIGNERR